MHSTGHFPHFSHVLQVSNLSLNQAVQPYRPDQTVGNKHAAVADEKKQPRRWGVLKEQVTLNISLFCVIEGNLIYSRWTTYSNVTC